MHLNVYKDQNMDCQADTVVATLSEIQKIQHDKSRNHYEHDERRKWKIFQSGQKGSLVEICILVFTTKAKFNGFQKEDKVSSFDFYTFTH